MLIFSTHSLHPQVTAALQGLGTLRIASTPTPAALMAESAGAEIIVVRAPIEPAIVAREAGLRALLRHGAGLDMIPVDAATAAGVLVTNVPGANAVTVAEHAIWTALALLRKSPEVQGDLRAKGWSAARSHSDHGRELSGRVMGIIGMGNVGQALARIAQHGFGMEVRAVTRRPAALPDGVRAMTLDHAMAADVLVLCCPLTPETRGMIGAAQLARMPQGGVLVNVARGPVVDEPALVAALQSGRISAALDVFDTQPLPPDHPLMALPNVILTPHMAGITEESMLRMGMGVVDEARRVLAGEKPLNFCNPEVWERYRTRFG